MNKAAPLQKNTVLVGIILFVSFFILSYQSISQSYNRDSVSMLHNGAISTYYALPHYEDSSGAQVYGVFWNYINSFYGASYTPNYSEIEDSANRYMDDTSFRLIGSHFYNNGYINTTQKTLFFQLSDSLKAAGDAGDTALQIYNVINNFETAVINNHSISSSDKEFVRCCRGYVWCIFVWNHWSLFLPLAHSVVRCNFF